MTKIERIELDITKEWVDQYKTTSITLFIRCYNEDRTRFSWPVTLTYGGKWEDASTHVCRSINKAYDGDKEEIKKIGEHILKEYDSMSRKNLLLNEQYERFRDIGSLLFRYIIR